MGCLRDISPYDQPSDVWRYLCPEFGYAVHTVEPLLEQFDPISLPEIGAVSLLNRIDTKYLLKINQLATILRQVQGTYRVLSIEELRLNRYQTLYYDTPDLALYRQHHNGRAERYKVRARRYVDSDLTFFEVKHKTNHQRTIKTRLRIPEVMGVMEQPVRLFVSQNTPFVAEDLEPKLWNRYLRATLVSVSSPERVTVDVNLEFEWRDNCRVLPGIAIVEVKQGSFSRDSDFIQQMRHLRVRPTAFSKYCAGIWLLDDTVKANRFKQQMRLVYKIMQGEMRHESIH